jgi:6-phospho-beta-glucosidase
LTLRGGYGYSTLVANLIKGVVTDDHSLNYVVVKNGTILKDLPEDSYVEVPALVKAEGIRPLQVDPLPEITRGLVVTMKCYERMAIEAAQRRDRTLLLHALMIHPLIFSYNIAAPLLEDVLATNADFLPDWK